MAEVIYIGQIKQLTHRNCYNLEVDTVLQMLKKIESNYGPEAYLMAKKSHIASLSRQEVITAREEFEFVFLITVIQWSQ